MCLRVCLDSTSSGRSGADLGGSRESVTDVGCFINVSIYKKNFSHQIIRYMCILKRPIYNLLTTIVDGMYADVGLYLFTAHFFNK